MFVVEMSSIGAEILCLMDPEEKDGLVVKLLFGISANASVLLTPLRAVKALDRDIFAECGSVKNGDVYFPFNQRGLCVVGNIGVGLVYPNRRINRGKLQRVGCL